MAVEQRKSGGLRAFDAVVLAAVAVVGVVVAFAALHFVVGMLWEAIKIVVIVGIVGGVLWLLLGRRR
jgi:uncharacterized membrane protein YeiH